MKRVFINRVGALGDVVMTTPIPRELHRIRGGEIEITFRTMYPAVYAGSPYVQHTMHSSVPMPGGVYDEVFDLDLVYELRPGVLVLDAYCDRVFGAPIKDSTLELWASDDQRRRASDLIKVVQGNPYIVVHPLKHSWPNRSLPIEFWDQLISKLLLQTPFHIVQIGTERDFSFEGHDRLHKLMNQGDIHVTQEIIRRAACFVGLDSAPLHLALATSTPIVAMFTNVRHEYRVSARPGSPSPIFVPLTASLPCYGCQETYPPPVSGYICHRGDAACAGSFNAQYVADQVKGVLESA